jgi:uncharacterized metal-binding protein YceD (DUF177 family)
MSPKAPSPSALRVAALDARNPTTFDLRPDAEGRAALARALNLQALRKLTFVGELRPSGGSDWELRGRLGATVVQPCVVTLEPVTTRIDTDITRRFLLHWQEPEGEEVEMPEDDSTEPLGTWIDPATVMAEALALAVPEYPRKDEAELGQLVHTRPGEAPMTDEDARPFAGLAGLRDKLKDEE